MRIALLLLSAAASIFAAPQSDEKDVVAVVQKLFDAMAAHDGDAALAVVIPGAQLVAARDNGAVTTTPIEEFATHLKAVNKPMLERIWNQKTFVSGRIALVWADYDFHLDGKFHHCGVDSVNLVKTAAGWKIAGIVYTAEATGCAPSPLGPPKE